MKHNDIEDLKVFFEGCNELETRLGMALMDIHGVLFADDENQFGLNAFEFSGSYFELYPQFQVHGFVGLKKKVRNYRVDFLIARPSIGKYVAIEVDGAEFHERTRDQIWRDKTRDRDLLKVGIVTLRFTGSEVYNRPVDCWNEALKFASEVE